MGLGLGAPDRCGIIDTNLLPSWGKYSSYSPVSWVDVSCTVVSQKGVPPGVLALEAVVCSVLTLSSMRKFSSVSPFSQVTSPASLTALGRTSRTSWAIIPRHKTLQQVESGRERPFWRKSSQAHIRKEHRQPQATGEVLANRCLSLLSFCFDPQAFEAKKEFWAMPHYRIKWECRFHYVSLRLRAKCWKEWVNALKLLHIEARVGHYLAFCFVFCFLGGGVVCLFC